MKSYFITGTDTGVGKTLITCALLHAMQTRGLKAVAMKPIAAGTEAVHGMNEDVEAFMRLSGRRFPLRDINPYCFAEAIAPHIAAQHEGANVDLDVIRAAYTRLQAASEVVLVEGAGGFLVPLSATRSMAELPVALGLDVVLVVGMRLGCLNHALLTAEALRARGLTLAGWVANTPAQAMSAFDENLATLQSLLPAPCLGVIPFLGHLNATEGEQAAATKVNIESLL